MDIDLALSGKFPRIPAKEYMKQLMQIYQHESNIPTVTHDLRDELGRAPEGLMLAPYIMDVIGEHAEPRIVWGSELNFYDKNLLHLAVQGKSKLPEPPIFSNSDYEDMDTEGAQSPCQPGNPMLKGCNCFLRGPTARLCIANLPSPLEMPLDACREVITATLPKSPHFRKSYFVLRKAHTEKFEENRAGFSIMLPRMDGPLKLTDSSLEGEVTQMPLEITLLKSTISYPISEHCKCYNEQDIRNINHCAEALYI